MAGKGVVAGFVDGDATTARFNYPEGVAVAANGALVVADRVSCTLSPFAFLAR
jgi:hypothetical protein